jgi:RNA polymerase sigma-70 factor (ECF subfamily)
VADADLQTTPETAAAPAGSLAELLSAAAGGDQAAFARLYAATRAKLYGVVIRILRRQELAEEVVQAAYLTIWRKAGQYRAAVASPLTWMVTIARNRAIDEVRKREAGLVDGEDEGVLEALADGPDPQARREMTDDLKRLLECVGQLDADRQRLVLLAYYNGWSREQLSTQLDIPVATVKTWLRRSMIDIRECLGA